MLATYGEILEWVQVHEAWEADRRAQRVLGGLGWPGWLVIIGSLGAFLSREGALTSGWFMLC